MLSGVVGSRENEREMIVHETTPESRTNQRAMHTFEEFVDHSSPRSCCDRIDLVA
jgi:hypothetical protein